LAGAEVVTSQTGMTNVNPIVHAVILKRVESLIPDIKMNQRFFSTARVWGFP
jgi:hypothetical protein